MAHPSSSSSEVEFPLEVPLPTPGVPLAEGVVLGDRRPLVVIAGPCMLESLELGLEVARTAKAACDAVGLPYIFKASYDKANRTSGTAERGPGLREGLAWLAKIKDEVGVPVLSDVHSVEEVQPAAEVLDVLQIPAFLCRQTDLLAAAGATGKPVNIKKGQFLAPQNTGPAVEKIRATGNQAVFLTERGASFGYNNLVVDMRGIPIMQQSAGCPVVFDATHSVQAPGGLGESTGGDRRMVPVLSRAAIAAGADGLFVETHPNPAIAKSDGPNQVPLDRFADLLAALAPLAALIRQGA